VFYFALLRWLMQLLLAAQQSSRLQVQPATALLHKHTQHTISHSHLWLAQISGCSSLWLWLYSLQVEQALAEVRLVLLSQLFEADQGVSTPLATCPTLRGGHVAGCSWPSRLQQCKEHIETTSDTEAATFSYIQLQATVVWHGLP
jgi:hypothetical protein